MIDSRGPLIRSLSSCSAPAVTGPWTAEQTTGDASILYIAAA